jgi:hypothetical protein
MKFTLDLAFEVGDASLGLASLRQSLAAHRDLLTSPDALEGRLVLAFDGKEAGTPYTDPLIRLVDLWLRKLPWIIGGDTETIALRNSEQCFAFVRTGASVEVSFFAGTEAEVDDYVMEPTVVRLEAFVDEVLRLGTRLLDLLEAIDSAWVQEVEAVRDLQTSFNEAKSAWHDHQVHQRR